MLESILRKGNPLSLLVGIWTGAATLENCAEVPQRVKNRPALRPSNCTVGDLPQRCRCNETLGHLHPDVYSSNVHSSQTVEGASVSIERWWIKKMWSMYTMEYSSAIRNDKYPPFASMWMELEGIMLSEISSIREGQTLYVLIHLGNINNSERENKGREKTVSYTHLTLPTNTLGCRSRWSPYH